MCDDIYWIAPWASMFGDSIDSDGPASIIISTNCVDLRLEYRGINHSVQVVTAATTDIMAHSVTRLSLSRSLVISFVLVLYQDTGQGATITSCGFENGLCNYIQRTDDQFNWKSWSGATPTANTGPSSAYEGSYYLYIETNSNPNGAKAVIQTRGLDLTGTACVSLAYHMYGEDIGTLHLWRWSPRLYLMTKTGNQGNKWFRYQERINNNVKPTTFLMEGIKGTGDKGDIAIDDFSVVTGTCKTTVQLPYSCSFESDLCDMWQTGSDDLDWIRTHTSTPTPAIGSHSDSGGSWIITLATDGQSSDEVASIETPELNFAGNICVRFKYYLSSNLTLLGVYSGLDANSTSLAYFNSTATGAIWRSVSITVRGFVRYQWITFSGRFTGGQAESMALDEISISTQICDDCAENNGGCNQTCSRTDTGRTCSCLTGYTQYGETGCQDIDECATSNAGCEQNCSNVDGSYNCFCNEGYELTVDNHTCTDINECLAGTHSCSDDCQNDVGSYSCSCPIGSFLQDDQRTCQACNHGYFGHACQSQCRCDVNAACDATSGICPSGCEAGWMTATCSIACTDGTFGGGCNGTCHCADTVACDPRFGTCPGACEEGWSKSNCSIAIVGNPGPGPGPSVGAIAGGVVAAVVIGAGVAVILVLFIRKRRQQKTDQNATQNITDEHLSGNDMNLTSVNVENGVSDSGPYVNFPNQSRSKKPEKEESNEKPSDVKTDVKATSGKNAHPSPLPRNGEGISPAERTPDLVRSSKMGSQEEKVSKGVDGSQASEGDEASVKNGGGGGTPPPKADNPMRVKPPGTVPKPTRHTWTFTLTSAIPGCASSLLSHTRNMRKDKKFETEFKSISKDPLYPWLEAVREGLKAKNRFKNILPYDKNRVHLNTVPGEPLSHYINASYIKGYSEDDSYIASHGPIEFTKRDFWRMVWEKDVPVVAMVTNLVEGGTMKCAKYWPDKAEERSYGDISITLTKEESWPDVTIRSFRLTMGAEKRCVEQCHYTSWPDHGVPEDATSILRFHKRVRQRMKPGKPTVVHCSAGVGRTGTFIAIDYLLQQAAKEDKVDVYKCVSDLRQQKVQMVQSQRQYEFIHDALLEALIVGDTTIPCDTLESHLESADEALQLQFQLLDELKPQYTPEDRATAFSKANKDKNLTPKIIPRESRRVILTSRVHRRTDYMNAVFVHSYQKKNAFVVTQMPLEDTMIDFWRMIHDLRCDTIVLIGQQVNDLLPGKQDEAHTVGQYHIKAVPGAKDGATEEMKTTAINVERVKQQPTYENVQTMSQNKETVNKEPEPSSQSVSCRVVEVAASLPTDLPASLLTRLYAIVHGPARGENTFIVFVCKDGGELSGVAVASFSMFDMMSLDSMVDVFHITKQVKDSRPEFIPTLDQYKQLHDIAGEYNKQFGMYANFR